MARPKASPQMQASPTTLSVGVAPDLSFTETPPLGTYTEIKHVIRGISRNNQANDEGALPAAVIEEYLGNLMTVSGWKLFQAYLIGTSPTFYQMLYILVR